MQNRLTVTIAGQKFSLVADEPEAYMKEIAALADQKIEEAKKLVGNTTFSTGVLATLNMAAAPSVRGVQKPGTGAAGSTRQK